MLTCEEGVAPFRLAKRLSENDNAALMGGTLQKVYKWQRHCTNRAAPQSGGIVSAGRNGEAHSAKTVEPSGGLRSAHPPSLSALAVRCRAPLGFGPDSWHAEGPPSRRIRMTLDYGITATLH